MKLGCEAILNPSSKQWDRVGIWLGGHMSLLGGVESYRSSRMVPVSQLPQAAPFRPVAEVHSLIPIDGKKTN